MMVDLIDRQAAIAALQKEINKAKPPFTDVIGSIRCGVRLARNIIEDLPSADIVEIVRCGECRHWHNAPAADGFNSCEMDALIRHENFFCANGERKDVWKLKDLNNGNPAKAIKVEPLPTKRGYSG